MGALVTLDLPPDSPVRDLPWIITVGPMHDDEEWEPVVCGPYERPHALALAQFVVADEDLIAVVEPLLLLADVDAIRDEIELARGATGGHSAGVELTGVELAAADLTDANLTDANLTDANLTDANLTDAGLVGAGLVGADPMDAALPDVELGDGGPAGGVRPTTAPTAVEVRAGMARIAARLTGDGPPGH